MHELLHERRPLRLLCDTSRLPACAVTVDAFARIAGLAGRHRTAFILQGVTAQQHGLIAWMGMADALFPPDQE